MQYLKPRQVGALLVAVLGLAACPSAPPAIPPTPPPVAAAPPAIVRPPAVAAPTAELNAAKEKRALIATYGAESFDRASFTQAEALFAEAEKAYGTDNATARDKLAQANPLYDRVLLAAASKFIGDAEGAALAAKRGADEARASVAAAAEYQAAEDRRRMAETQRNAATAQRTEALVVQSVASFNEAEALYNRARAVALDKRARADDALRSAERELQTANARIQAIDTEIKAGPR